MLSRAPNTTDARHPTLSGRAPGLGHSVEKVHLSGAPLPRLAHQSSVRLVPLVPVSEESSFDVASDAGVEFEVDLGFGVDVALEDRLGPRDCAVVDDLGDFFAGSCLAVRDGVVDRDVADFFVVEVFGSPEVFSAEPFCSGVFSSELVLAVLGAAEVLAVPRVLGVFLGAEVVPVL